MQKTHGLYAELALERMRLTGYGCDVVITPRRGIAPMMRDDMKQDHFAINIAIRESKMYDRPLYVHYCLIKKPCSDFSVTYTVNDFVAELRKAFAVIGEFKITVTRYTYRGESLDI